MQSERPNNIAKFYGRNASSRKFYNISIPEIPLNHISYFMKIYEYLTLLFAYHNPDKFKDDKFISHCLKV